MRAWACGHRLPGGLLGGRRRGQLARGRLAAPLGRGQPGGRLVRRRPLLQQALLPRAAALGPVRPEQVTVPGDHLQRGVGPNDPACLLQVIGDDHVAEQLAAACRQPVRRAHHVGGADQA